MTGHKLNVLMVEDSDADARLLKEIMKEADEEGLELERAESFWDAKLRLERGHYDAMLVDLGLPDSQGMETLLRLQADAPGVPIVVLTGLRSDEAAREAVRSGAQDYLVKGEISGRGLRRSLMHAIERHQLRRDMVVKADQLKRSNLRLFRLSHFDPLTKVLNRRGFQKVLARESQRARETGQPLAALLVDLDHFKEVNEAYSHAAGDFVLHSVAGVLKSGVRGLGHVSRIGGDEFMVLLRRCPEEEALRVAERLLLEIGQLPKKPWYRDLPPVTASIGVVEVPLPGNDLPTLLKRCHAPLARRKAAGRNGVFAEETTPENGHLAGP